MTGKTLGRILIVDDQRNWRRTLKQILSAEGHEVVLAATLAEAEAALSGATFDLAIVDMRLVDEDEYDVQGIELLNLIKKREPQTCAIILTGYRTEELEQKARREYGADEFLNKAPSNGFDNEVFKQTIIDLVRKSQSRRL
jgi:DNA-binding NtrC family response regulator